jgi:hypothetical protein
MSYFFDPRMSLSDRQKAARVWTEWWRKHERKYENATFDSVDRRWRTVASLYIIEW